MINEPHITETRRIKSMKYFLTAILLLFFQGCNRDSSPVTDETAYRSEMDKWREQRITDLKAPDGWLNLAGLYWLHDGSNSFGSDSSNDIVFPEDAPSVIGVFELTEDTVYLQSAMAPLMINGIPAVSTKLKDDLSGEPDIMTLHSFSWFIIRRADRYGIRLRDFDSPTVDSLHSIPVFETDEKWCVMAEYKPYNEPEKAMVQTVIGTEEENLIPGELTFRLKGKKFTLYPFESENSFFIVFGDQTNGYDTYPSGRFLDTDMPDSQNRVIIDFNKAYNPPCAFTPYATCPLPLRKNILPVKIEAGEKVIHLLR
jgi:uncharacterized protein